MASFTNVTLASGAATTFYPVTTENIGGTTYYVATLDPPTSSDGAGSTGATGAKGDEGAKGDKGDKDDGRHAQWGGATGPSGHSDPLTTTFGGNWGEPRFIPPAAGAGGAGDHGHQDHGTPGGLGLDSHVSIEQLTSDLTNLANLIASLLDSRDGQGSGAGVQTPPDRPAIGVGPQDQTRAELGRHAPFVDDTSSHGHGPGC